jgi:ligand-binding SRPBCC domain-containing protein
MARGCGGPDLPEGFAIGIERLDGYFVLNTSQILPVPREKAFSFFQDPRNLCDITPDWLDFRMDCPEAGLRVSEGAEYDYHIRWLWIKVAWKSRISRYNPPHDFTDIQVEGPYSHWEHRHIFEECGEKTVMRDAVEYSLPFSIAGRICHGLLVRRQLEDIFCYRAKRISQWAGSCKQEQGSTQNTAKSVLSASMKC